MADLSRLKLDDITGRCPNLRNMRTKFLVSAWAVALASGCATIPVSFKMNETERRLRYSDGVAIATANGATCSWALSGENASILGGSNVQWVVLALRNDATTEIDFDPQREMWCTAMSVDNEPVECHIADPLQVAAILQRQANSAVMWSGIAGAIAAQSAGTSTIAVNHSDGTSSTATVKDASAQAAALRASQADTLALGDQLARGIAAFRSSALRRNTIPPTSSVNGRVGLVTPATQYYSRYRPHSLLLEFACGDEHFTQTFEAN